MLKMFKRKEKTKEERFKELYVKHKVLEGTLKRRVAKLIQKNSPKIKQLEEEMKKMALKIDEKTGKVYDDSKNKQSTQEAPVPTQPVEQPQPTPPPQVEQPQPQPQQLSPQAGPNIMPENWNTGVPPQHNPFSQQPPQQPPTVFSVAVVLVNGNAIEVDVPSNKLGEFLTKLQEAITDQSIMELGQLGDSGSKGVNGRHILYYEFL